MLNAINFFFSIKVNFDQGQVVIALFLFLFILGSILSLRHFFFAYYCLAEIVDFEQGQLRQIIKA